MMFLKKYFPLLAVTLLPWPGTLAANLAANLAAGAPPPAQAYVWRNVVIGGGGFVTGLAFHPGVPGLLYARTDVGGAYRWEAGAQKWIPLMDWLGPADNNLLGIESLALDPADPQRLYLAAGTYSRGEAAILRSEDQGRTFQRTAVPFKMGGNESGRFNGERLAVDPNNGEILFFGSRHDGLWQSHDRGATWQNVAGFSAPGGAQPAVVEGGPVHSRPPVRRGFGHPQAVGIVSVVFDPASGQPGRATPKIFAAVSTAATNLFASVDAGATWQAVPDQPVGLCPNHLVLSPDGMVYLSYGSDPGPNGMNDGVVWKFDPQAGAWTDITPLKSPDAGAGFGYGAVAVDARHPATVMVTTFAHWRPHDYIFRSLDGGGHWTGLEDAGWDHANAPYTRTRTPHWMGTVAINPFDADQVLITTGYGIWSCVNATQAEAGRPTRWVFLNAGLEETVPLALISPPTGAHLLSGVGDVDGFRHDDLNQSPAEGAFAGPHYGNTETLAFAGQNPGVIVRAGTGGKAMVRAAVSHDGGGTWRALETEPPTGDGAGDITISADAGTVVWTPRGGAPWLTTNWGTRWTACAGLATGIRVVADAVEPQRFYAFDARAGKFFASTDGAVSFADTEAKIAGRENAGFGPAGGATVTAASGTAQEVWLAWSSAGLFHSTNGGASFTRLTQVQEAGSLGLGKAAKGQTSPAMFLAGKISGVAGLFRSDDVGESWVRINDDQHQYGYISRVTGDPRVYGRVYFATGGRGVIYGDILVAPDTAEK